MPPSEYNIYPAPDTEYNIYPTSEIFAGSTDASENDFIINNDDSSPYEGGDTSPADETSQSDFYLEGQEPLIDPEITITTEVDSPGIEIEADPSDTLNDIERPTILPYLEDSSWSIPKAWWRGAISLDADSGELMEQPYAVSIALSTLPGPEASIQSSPELLEPKFDYVSQESDVSSQVLGVELLGQELSDENPITTPVLFANNSDVSENIEFELLRPLLLTFETPVPSITGDEQYSPSAGLVEAKSVPSPVEPIAADLLDETQQSSVGDDAMAGLNLLPDLEAILQRLINGSLRH